jgi:hypothetical protein
MRKPGPHIRRAQILQRYGGRLFADMVAEEPQKPGYISPVSFNRFHRGPAFPAQPGEEFLT